MADLPQLVTSHQVQEAIGKATQLKQVVMLYFTAKWCGPCKNIKPFVQQLQSNYATQLVVYAIDIDAANAVDNKLVDHFEIRSVPTFIFIRNNQVVSLVKGADAEAVQQKLNQVLQC